MVPFDDFFRAIWGFGPHPWQSRLAAMVQREGWPPVLDLPTGAGKTAVLDIALHHLVVSGGASPRRLILVVDRRVIVDQAGERAEHIRRAVENPEGGRTSGDRAVLSRIQAALRALVGEGAPLLHTEVLRGGQVRQDAWIRFPQVPVLAASTVDQVGSRLLFRGYGVSDQMRPIHAGLLGCDTLLFLDEVHLARPFADTLSQLEEMSRASGRGTLRPSGTVLMSATPGRGFGNDGAGGAPFRLSPEDRSSPVLARILTAPKVTELREIRVPARDEEAKKRQALASAAAEAAVAFVEAGAVAVALVVNRVDTARRAWTALQDLRRAGIEVDVHLLTGRMRPLDQEATLTSVAPRVMAGRLREQGGPPIIVVATQCIEAGADFDFDALVTEAAPLDALRQRFGRVDRRGDLAESGPPGLRGIVLCRSDLVTGDDPVYGPALGATWRWLRKTAGPGGRFDFGIQALEEVAPKDPEDAAELVAKGPEAPVLLPMHLDQWCQTSPRPQADPDVSLFLHGIPSDARSALEDVQVVWRADIEEEQLRDAATRGDGAAEGIEMLLATVPPGTLEAISLPVWTVRSWLTGEGAAPPPDDLTDVEALFREPHLPAGRRRLVMRWSPPDARGVVPVDQVRPGDTIVVPVSYGGIGPHGTFDPVAAGSVPTQSDGPRITDLGDVVQWHQRNSPSLRLDPRVLPVLARPLPTPDALPEEEEDPGAPLRDALDRVRTGVEDPASPPWLEAILEALNPGSVRFVWTGVSWVALGRGKPGALLPTLDPLAVDDELSSFIGRDRRVLLRNHLSGVGTLARQFGEQVGLTRELCSALYWAGRLHDVGKSDPRFLMWLNGGDEIAARYGEPLAKSPLPWQDVGARREARRRARYPEGQRHELVGLAMIEASQELSRRLEAEGVDRDLVLHLVASHHGWCRPLAPVVEFGAGETDVAVLEVEGLRLAASTKHDRGRIDSGCANRFWRLVHCYGHHGLAYLEAILRLADHRLSEVEETG